MNTNATITQYEKDLATLKKERSLILNTKKALKKDGVKIPNRDVKALKEVEFKINVTKTELNKLYAESKKINKDFKSAIKVSTQEKKRELDSKLKTKKSNLSVKK